MARLFERDALESLFGLVGRSDLPVYQLAGDLELCFQAFLASRRGDVHGGLPGEVAADLVDAQRLAQELRAVLQRLPLDVRRLIDLNILSDGAYRRAAADVEDLRVPLEDFATAIEAVLREATGEEIGIAELEDKLCAAIATAYRNRLGLVPTNEPDGGFMRFLDGVLDLLRRIEPMLAPVRAHLDAVRVGAILEARVPRPDARIGLELLPADAVLALPDTHPVAPFVLAR